MIEVEKKYYTSSKVYDFLYHQADFVSEKIIDDVYFDTEDHILSLDNRYLRNRNGIWEMKVSTESFDTEFPTYDELTSDIDIINSLDINTDKLTFESLEAFGLKPFVKYRSMRKKFTYNEFTLDLDETDFDLEYIEIELMVNKKSDIDKAKKKILKLACKIDPDIKHCRNGKFRYFLLNNFPDLEREMEKRGIFEPLNF